MNLLQAIADAVDAMKGRPNRWNQDEDQTMRYLRAQRAHALAETRRLRQGPSWEELLRPRRDGGS